MDYELFLTQSKQFFKYISNIDSLIDSISKKLREIHKMYIRFNKNTLLIKTNSFLTFQTDSLKNELTYYRKIKKIILQKFKKELIDISDYILIMLFSLEKIELDNNADKKLILSKKKIFKKNNSIDIQNIKEIIDINVINLKLIDNFINLYDNYIQKTESINNKKNIHCTNFKLITDNKKNQINLEFKKYYNQLKELLVYFVNCSEAISKQIENPKLLDFFLFK